MRYTRFALVPLILVIIIVILFLANSKDDSTSNNASSNYTSSSNISSTSSPAPTSSPNVLGAQTNKQNNSDTTPCGLVTSESELKDITGSAFKKQNSDLENGQSLNCKYVYSNQVIDFYLVNNGQDQYAKLKSDSTEKISSNDSTFDSFFVKNSDGWSFYLLDSDRFVSGTMPQLQNDSVTQEKLKELTERLLVRD